MPITFYNHGYGPVSLRRIIRRSVWPYFDLFWVHSGKMRMLFEPSGECLLEGGQGVLIYPRTPFRSGEIEQTCRASVQHFGLKTGADLPSLFRGMIRLKFGYEHLTTSSPDAADAMIGSAIRLAAAPPSDLVHDLRVAQLTLLLGELKLRQQTAHTEPHKIAALLGELEHEPIAAVTIEKMATRAGLSASHFRAVFKARQGETPSHHLRYIRMREAARLLRETDRPIKQIAMQLGFLQLGHFYRMFKSIHRVAPARYRAEHLTWA